MKTVRILFILVGFISYDLKPECVIFPDFDVAHEKCENSIKTDLFRKIYKNNSNAEVLKSPLIPLKIHQIWIGPKPLPEKFKWMVKTWKDKHPSWEYKLWVNEDLKKFKLTNRAAFDKAKNWGAKSDILRYEIVNRYGGVYVDIDFECIKPLDQLNYTYDFYSCLIGGTADIANGLVASKANHPVLIECIKRISNIKKFSSNHNDILNTTGPRFFTDIVIDFLQQKLNNKIIILPASFFFPFPRELRKKFWSGLYSNQEVYSFLKSESFAIHYWATSWQDK